MSFVESLSFWLAAALAPFLIFAAFAALLFAGVFVEHWLSKWKWRRIASKPRKTKEADQ